MEILQAVIPVLIAGSIVMAMMADKIYDKKAWACFAFLVAMIISVIVNLALVIVR